MTVDVAIIGGGAAGLAAGIEAGRRGLGTLIIERNNELGKKILQTGNGRCNISHADVKAVITADTITPTTEKNLLKNYLKM